MCIYIYVYLYYIYIYLFIIIFISNSITKPQGTHAVTLAHV